MLHTSSAAAKERKSDILHNILFLPEKDDSVIPFYKILNEIHQDTALYRRQDNKDFCFLSDYRKRLSRTQNFHKKKQNIPKMSQEKRQLLIENAFKRTYERTSLSQEQGIDLCNNDYICPQLFAPNPNLCACIKKLTQVFAMVFYLCTKLYLYVFAFLPPLSLYHKSSHLYP